jgi:hypothetical protein
MHYCHYLTLSYSSSPPDFGYCEFLKCLYLHMNQSGVALAAALHIHNVSKPELFSHCYSGWQSCRRSSSTLSKTISRILPRSCVTCACVMSALDTSKLISCWSLSNRWHRTCAVANRYMPQS